MGYTWRTMSGSSMYTIFKAAEVPSTFEQKSRTKRAKALGVD
jgi:hypothetical protein